MHLLETIGLHRVFDGLVAVSSVDFQLHEGEIHALIGPNGAGKTTLAGMITGRIRPTSGRIFFAGQEITGLRAESRVLLGIASTFQIPTVFRNLTVFENIALAVQRMLLRHPFDFFLLREDNLTSRVWEVLEQVGLHGSWKRPAGSLPYGHQRLLEIAMALALRPRLLILDEPTQGLAPEEITGLMALIRLIAREKTVLLIEHNVRVVLELSDRITVMDHGHIVFEGTPSEVEVDPTVQQVYLGAGRWRS
ncbi:MAG: ABC transporter ATP-binding protein [Armatimonadota bacterium]|nr:ABC transporter ATP-binding protein [Armatimonadota bacterium]